MLPQIGPSESLHGGSGTDASGIVQGDGTQAAAHELVEVSTLPLVAARDDPSLHVAAASRTSASTFGQRLEGVSTPPSPPPVVSPMTHATPRASSEIMVDGATKSPPYRRSSRHSVAADGASRTDEDSMSKAMRLQAARNLDFSPGTSTPKSFVSFPDAHIQSNLESVGIGLGSSGSKVKVAVKVLKHVEVDRLSLVPKGNIHPTISELDDDEDEAAHDGHLLAHIVGCVSEVGLNETRLGSLCELKASTCKSKSHFNKKINTPSKRARVTKSPIVSK